MTDSPQFANHELLNRMHSLEQILADYAIELRGLRLENERLSAQLTEAYTYRAGDTLQPEYEAGREAARDAAVDYPEQPNLDELPF